MVAIPRRSSAGLRGHALDERAAEDEIVAEGIDPGTGANEIEVPQTVGGISEQHHADETPVRDHELLVGAEAGVGQHDRLGAGAAEEIAGGKYIDARNLEIGGEDAAGITYVVAGEAPGEHARLLIGGLHQTVANA